MQNAPLSDSRGHASNRTGLMGVLVAAVVVAMAAPAAVADHTAATRTSTCSQQRIVVPSNTCQTGSPYGHTVSQVAHHRQGHQQRHHGHARTHSRTYTHHGRHDYRSGIRFDIGSRIRIGLPNLSFSIGTGHYTHGYRPFTRDYGRTHVRTYTQQGCDTPPRSSVHHDHQSTYQHGRTSYQRGERNNYGERIYGHANQRVERLRQEHYGHRRVYDSGCRTYSLNPYHR